MTKAAELAKMGEVITNSQLGGRRNILINGDFKIWQRATSSTAANYSGPDRWYYGNAGTYSRSTDVPSGEGFQYSNNVKVTAATSYGVTAQRIEAVNCKHLVGKTVTASFWLKTISGSTYMTCILYRANTEDGHNSGVTVIESKTFTGVTGTWTYYTLTWSNLPSETTNGLQLYFFSADAGTDPEYRITGIQLEVGEQATPFEHRSFGEEFDLCLRYYEKSSAYGEAEDSTAGPNIYGVVGMAGSASSVGNNDAAMIHWQKPKRATPTLVFYDAVGNSGKLSYAEAGVGRVDNIAIRSSNIGVNRSRIGTAGASSLDAGEAVEMLFQYTADSEL